MILEVIKAQPFTCAILILYAGNIPWQLTQNRPGQALYWLAACIITISATWGMGWRL